MNHRKRIWFDTEMIEDGKTIELVSIGLVDDADRTYEAVSTEFDAERANHWVKSHVLPKLPSRESGLWKPRAQIAREILDFVGADTPRFIAYYGSYDWVVLCQLYGSMIDLPKGWPMWVYDIKQLATELGNPELPVQSPNDEHSALADARWTKMAHIWLNELRASAKSGTSALKVEARIFPGGTS